MRYIKLLPILLAVAAIEASLATAQVTSVTTTITTTQEERRQTRFTLTEWLRIKERMKMMDVWLAMFSDPKTESFSPELNLEYGLSQSTFNLKRSDASDQGATQGESGRAQLWLTNLLTASTGKKWINIDFGIEGFQRTPGVFTPDATPRTIADNEPRKSLTRYGAGTFRLFGKNIQDTSLALKFGAYDHNTNLLARNIATEQAASFSGLVAGAEAQIYFLKSLGIAGGYNIFGGSNPAKMIGFVSAKSSEPTGGGSVGRHGEVNAFLEISLLRIFVGQFTEEWTYNKGDQNLEETTTKEAGRYGGMRIQF